ncbi:Elongation factor 1-gamma, partial [Coemansia sp. RSA 2607]
MVHIGKLYGPTVNFRNYKARIVAKYLGLDIDITPEFQMGVDNKTPEYLAKYPAGKAPVFEGADGFSLSQSGAIAYYVASKSGSESTLLGQTPEETAEILQFILFGDATISPIASAVLNPLLGIATFTKPAHQQAEKDFAEVLKELNTLLVDRTFLVGERLTVADIVVACDLIMTFKLYLEEADRKEYRNLTRYFKTMVAQPAFKAVIGDVELCKERVKAAAPAKKEKKEKKPAQEPKPKAEKPTPKPAEVEDEEEA